MIYLVLGTLISVCFDLSFFVHSSSTEASGSIPLTGDAQADADIMAFLKARQNVIKAGNHIEIFK